MRVRILVAALTLTLGLSAHPAPAAVVVPAHDWVKVQACVLATGREWHWGPISLGLYSAKHTFGYCLRRY